MANTFFATGLTLPQVTPPASLPQMQTPLGAADCPLALLPVRLETRFFAQPNGDSELRVRIYPDKIHIDSHETDLTPAEKQWGEHYWTQVWGAANDAQAQANAWRQLADRYEVARAAWIVRVLHPTNMQDRALGVPPQFPGVAVANNEVAWRSAPSARLLPDRWCAIVQSGGRPVLLVTGRDIQRPLAVGPDPRAPEAAIDGADAAVDAGMKWMVDFAAAEEKGMALRILVPAQILTAGIDSLFVLGVASDQTPADGAQQMSRLLDAHHYTDGLAFLRPGTPSNNSAERRAGFNGDDTGHARSFATEIADMQAALPADSNALRLGTALGLATHEIAPVLGNIEEARAQLELDMRSMNTALWHASWGYFLTNMIGFEGTGLTPEIVTWAREYFQQHVRALGPFAPLRCGKQPYGVLPVTSLDLWQPLAGEGAPPARDSFLCGFLRKLRENVWRPSLNNVARIGRRQTPPDPDADLTDVMRTDALSNGYSARAMMGRHFLQHLRAFVGEDLQANGFIATHDAATIGIVQRLGFGFRPRLARGIYADLAFPVKRPLVQAGEVSSTHKVEPNYIGDLLGKTSIADLVNARPSPSLLHALLRHAMLLEYTHAAAAIAATQAGENAGALLKDAELIDLISGGTLTGTSKRLLERTVGPITGSNTVRAFLERLTTFQTDQTRSLGAFRASLAHLQDRDSEALQYLMQSTLDLAVHRLDAWVTSVATKRLTAMRAMQPQGLYVGGYGWVENLRPAPVPAVASSPTGETGPLVAPTNDSGFIHAPSMTHAATAALLRNAHLGATGVPQASGPFAIDLSSRRVREASWLLDGVRQGQPLGALLGYRFERRLHELTLSGTIVDQYLPALRELAPLSAGKLEQTALPLESIAANNVVDGLVLYQKWLANEHTVTHQLEGHANAPPQAVAAIVKEIRRLGDAIDAVSDALTAETAYQMVRGNTMRTASTLNAIANGEAPPPELEVARTPRSGTALTHRLLVLFSGAPATTPGWATATQSARAAAEPMLNAWVAKLMGDPRKTRCTVERLDEQSGAVLESRTFALAELRLAPLDMVYGVQAEPRAEQMNEIELRILDHVRHKTGTAGFPLNARVRIQHARPVNLAALEHTLLDVLEQARAVRRLVASVRGADAEDLTPPERASTDTVNLAQWDARVVKAEKALQTAHKALDTQVKKGVAATVLALRTAMLKLCGFGMPAAVPATAAGDAAAEQAALLLQGAALLKESKARIDQGATLRAAGVITDARAKRNQLTSRLNAVFGGSFVTLPQFTCAHAAELSNALAASTQTQGGDTLAVHTWFARCARVRESAGRLGAVLRGAEVLNTGDRLNLRVAQLPFNATERWVALPPEPGKALPPSKLSLVVHAPAAIDSAQVLTGLMIDEWVEIVPGREETTAIAFQFNPPDVCAPQTVLLAVPPVPGTAWTVASLHRVLAETLDMAKLRAIDAEGLGELSHYLPALYFAFNTNDEAVSTDFAPLTS